VTWVPETWVFALATGLVLSTIFLSTTLITGRAGQLSLCQMTFAGVGAFTAGGLALHFGTSVLVGAAAGGVLAAVLGGLVALPALRLSGLAVTIVTLAFALLCDNVLFQYSWAGGAPQGVNVPRPQIGPIDFASDRSFLVLAFVFLCAGALLVNLVRKGTVGRYLDAMRGSEIAAGSMGINLSASKMRVVMLSAGIAGVGGVLYASLQSTVSPTDFVYFWSIVFVVVVVTTGVQSVEGAVQAGMGFAILALLLSYLPTRFQGIEAILFAFGAINYAKHPEGIVEYQKRRWLLRVERAWNAWDQRRAQTAPSEPGASPQPAVVQDASA
jgi:branched-chain amino acid transport system permease protein